MLTVIFAATTVISAFCGLISWVGRAALIKWILDKGHTPPTDKELSDCINYVWRRLLRIK